MRVLRRESQRGGDSVSSRASAPITVVTPHEAQQRCGAQGSEPRVGNGEPWPLIQSPGPRIVPPGRPG
jgi:hypothetical protein